MRFAKAIACGLERLEIRRFLSNYVVSPTGSDGGTGADVDPWATLQHAAYQVKPGDKIRFTADRVNGQITVTKIQKRR